MRLFEYDSVKVLKSALLILLLTFVPIQTSAQLNEARIDSLKLALQSFDLDRNRVETLIRIGITYGNAHEIDSALIYGNQALLLSEELGYAQGIGSANRDLGLWNWQLGNLRSAKGHFSQAIIAYVELGDSLGAISSKFNLGLVLSDQGEYDQASECFFEALDYFEKKGNEMNVATILNSIGLLQSNSGDWDAAEHSFKKSIAISEEQNAPISAANAYSNLGTIYEQRELLEDAESCYLKALEIDQQQGELWGVGFQLSNLGSISKKRGRYSQAVDYQKRALEIRREFGEKVHLTSNLNQLGEALIADSKPREAIQVLTESREIASSIESIEYEKDAEENLSIAYQECELWKESLSSARRSSSLKDSIQAMKREQKVLELTEKYQVEKKETENRLLKSENELKDADLEKASRTRIGLLIGLTLLGFIGALVWIGQRRKIKSERAIAKKNEQIRSAEFKELMTDLELKALRAQMNPHFVFNSMNSINRMILENRNEEASRNLTKFSKLIRMILEHSERERITVPEEMNLIKSYVELEEVRLKGQIDLRFEVDPSLDLEVTEIPSMLLQPVVENAIWHGIAPTTGNSGRIDINLELENDMIICSITDDGIGFESANQTNSHKSMATSIIKDRLTSLSDGQSDSFELINRSSIEEGVCGTVARMKFPI